MTPQIRPRRMDTAANPKFLEAGQSMNGTVEKIGGKDAEKSNDSDGTLKGIRNMLGRRWRPWRAIGHTSKADNTLIGKQSSDKLASKIGPEPFFSGREISKPIPLYSLSLENKLRQAKRENHHSLQSRRRGHDKGLSVKSNSVSSSEPKPESKSKNVHGRNTKARSPVNDHHTATASSLYTFLHSPSPPHTPVSLPEKKVAIALPLDLRQQKISTGPVALRGPGGGMPDIPTRKASAKADGQSRFSNLQGQLCLSCGVVHPMNSGYTPTITLFQEKGSIQKGLQNPRKSLVSHPSRKVMGTRMPTISEEHTIELNGV